MRAIYSYRLISYYHYILCYCDMLYCVHKVYKKKTHIVYCMNAKSVKKFKQNETTYSRMQIHTLHAVLHTCYCDIHIMFSYLHTFMKSTYYLYVVILSVVILLLLSMLCCYRDIVNDKLITNAMLLSVSC